MPSSQRRLRAGARGLKPALRSLVGSFRPARLWRELSWQRRQNRRTWRARELPEKTSSTQYFISVEKTDTLSLPGWTPIYFEDDRTDKSPVMRMFAAPDHLDEHILRSYSVLRWFMVGFGFALPLVLVIGGIHGLWWLSESLPVQDSLSAYYHAGPPCIPFQGVYRDLFVGLLAAISFCLIIYSGFGKLENWLLNGAGVCLAGVAFFPMGWPEPRLLDTCRTTPGFMPHQASGFLGLPVSVHNVAAVAFFLTITAVNVLTAMDTVDIIQNTSLRHRWRRIFQWARWLMPASLGLVLLLRLFTGTSLIGDRLVLWLEWAGIWAFSLYWLLKSIEILGSRVDVAVIHRTVGWSTTSHAGALDGRGREPQSQRRLRYLQ